MQHGRAEYSIQTEATPAVIAAPKPSKLRKLSRPLLLSTSCIAFIGLLVLTVWWIRYPHIPDVGNNSLDQSIAFMGSMDFNRLTQRDRKRFALAVIGKLKDNTFAELLSQMMEGMRDDVHRQAAKNVNQLSDADKEAIGGAMFRLFLDKFYDEPVMMRNIHLSAMVAAEQAGGGQGRKQQGLPEPARFKKDMSKFLTNQPPHVQAQVGQFMTDMRRQREVLGFKQPW